MPGQAEAPQNTWSHTMTHTPIPGQIGAELGAADGITDRPEAHAAIAAAIAAEGHSARTADHMAQLAVRALLPLLDDVDEDQGPANFTEDNYEAGWHDATNELRVKL